MRKILMMGLFFSLALNLYLSQSLVGLRDGANKFVYDDFDKMLPITKQFSDSIELAQSGMKKLGVKKSGVNKIIQNIQQSWLEKSSEFFKTKLSLNDQQIITFHELKSNRERELDDYILPKISAHREKYGDVPYISTMKDSVFLGKLNEKYMYELKKLFGDENFELYESFKNAFNRKLIYKNKQDIIDF